MAGPIVLKQLSCVAESLGEAGQIHAGEGGSLQRDAAVVLESRFFLAYSG